MLKLLMIIKILTMIRTIVILVGIYLVIRMYICAILLPKQPITFSVAIKKLSLTILIVICGIIMIPTEKEIITAYLTYKNLHVKGVTYDKIQNKTEEIIKYIHKK